MSIYDGLKLNHIWTSALWQDGALSLVRSTQAARTNENAPRMDERQPAYISGPSSTWVTRIASRPPTGEELPEQLKLQGLSDQQLRRSPAKPARCPGLTRAVDCRQTTKTMTATKTRQRLWAGTHLSLILLWLWQSTNLIASFLFNFHHHSCFAVIEYGDGNLPPP